MKNLFLLLFITTFLSGCERDYIKNNTLPPLTHTGDNTAGCLVNGEVFVPKGKWFDRKLNCRYVNSNFVLDIYKNEKKGYKNLSIYCLGIDISHENIGTSRTLSVQDFNLDSYASGYYFISFPYYIHYTTNNDFKGELVITFFDSEKNIISDIFWFDAVNSEGEVIEVRDGRFDMKYQEY